MTINPESIFIEDMINDPSLDRVAILNKEKNGKLEMTTGELVLADIAELGIKKGANEELIKDSMNFDSQVNN